MSFVQIIEMRTKRFEELQALQDEWKQATEGRRTVQRAVLARDRNDADRYVILAFFDSFESAMENSNLPETSEFADKQAALLDGSSTFTDLDIIDELV